jgi:hypothetical protein
VGRCLDLSRWDDDIEWARLDGPFFVGSHGKLKPQGIPAAGFTLISVVPGVSYTVEQRLPLATLRFHRELGVTDGGSTRFTHRVTIAGPLASSGRSHAESRLRRASQAVERAPAAARSRPSSPPASSSSVGQANPRRKKRGS